MQDLPWRRHVGPDGVRMQVQGSSSSDFLDYIFVFSAVFIVLTWHLIKPLDLGKWGRR